MRSFAVSISRRRKRSVCSRSRRRRTSARPSNSPSASSADSPTPKTRIDPSLKEGPLALKSTIFKAQVSVADIDHGYYADHALTIARHPSETDERMMIRLVALALKAHKLQDVLGGDGTLGFGAGLSSPDEPDVILRDYTGRASCRIEIGQHE